MIRRRRTKAGDDKRPLTARSLLALALTLEREAARRYDTLAARMASYGNIEAAELFASLAAEERHHQTAVERLLAIQGSIADTATPPSAPPEAIAPEAEADAGGPHLMTPFRALRLATDAEQRAFQYYIDIAAHATDDALRRQAEELANEELEHLARIRKERRRAWHAERRGSGSLTLPIRSIATTDTLLARARAIESEARAELVALASLLPTKEGSAAAFLAEEAGREDDLLKTLALKSPSLTAAGMTDTPSPSHSRPLKNAQEALLVALASAEQAIDTYLAIAEQSPREDVLELAQWLAECAMQRLKRIALTLDQSAMPTAPGAA
ncbi:MAG: ferritin family protein [Alphaproteobacteria bacterium]